SVTIDDDVKRVCGNGGEVVVTAGEGLGMIAPRVSVSAASTPSAANGRRKLSMQITPTATRKPPVTPQKSSIKRRHSAAVNVALSSAKKPASRPSSMTGMITATLGEADPWLEDIKNPNDSNTDLLVGEDLTSPVLHLDSHPRVA
ncbi:MAG: hypothetical protein ACK56I_02570, partial [bacterium]